MLFVFGFVLVSNRAGRRTAGETNVSLSSLTLILSLSTSLSLSLTLIWSDDFSAEIKYRGETGEQTRAKL